MLFCAGCDDRGAETGDLSIDASTAWRDDRLVVETGVDFTPSDAMLEALERGVGLRIDVITRVSRRVGPLAIQADRRRHAMRIRFLPLTEQWQLETENGQQTFPRRWLLLDALERPREYDTGLVRSDIGPGDWQIQARAAFNRADLPPPMHLPSLFSPEWRLKSAWQTWRVGPS